MIDNLVTREPCPLWLWALSARGLSTTESAGRAHGKHDYASYRTPPEGPVSEVLILHSLLSHSSIWRQRTVHGFD
jgi:hypothetical protein